MNNITLVATFVFISGVFFVLHYWLTWRVRNWYQTTGKVVNRSNAFKPWSIYQQGSLIEFTDKNGKIRQSQAQENAVFWSGRVQIRVSPTGAIHVVGVERIAVVIGVMCLVFAILFALIPE